MVQLRRLFIAVNGLLIFASVASAAIPQNLMGSYTLKRGVYGMCETPINVYAQPADRGSNNIFVGAFIFPRVNAGEWTTDDTVQKSRHVTTYGAGVLRAVTDTHVHANGMHTQSIVEATFSGSGNMRFLYRMKGEYSTLTECQYVKSASTR